MKTPIVAAGLLSLPMALLAATPAAAEPSPVVPPQRLDTAEVPYPAGASGDAEVVVVLVVDDRGVVTDLTLRDGAAPFASAAITAMRGWHFAPATKGNRPVAARIVARVTFRAPPSWPPTSPGPAPRTAAPQAPGATEPQEVSVRGEREEPSAIHVPRTESRLVAGAFGDPFKVLEALPGTTPWLSGLPYYFVRGAPPETVVYFVDGIRVPLLFHVGPGPSTIAPALVDSVDLFPGAYPARYGRYAGAIIAGETAAPVTDHAHGEFSARVYDASAFAEMPFDGGDGTVLAASRYAYTGPLISLIVPDYSLDYWDYQLRGSHALGGGGTLTVFAFGAHDELHYRGQPSFRVEYHRLDVRYDRRVEGGNVRVALTSSYDDSLTTVGADSANPEHAAQGGPGWRLRAEVDERLGADARLRAGADLAATMFRVDDSPVIEGTRPPVGPHTDTEGGAYADIVWHPVRSVEVVPGARFDGSMIRGRAAWAPQPRLATRVRLLPRLAWVSAMGTAHQEPGETIFVPGKRPDALSRASQDAFQLAEGLEVALPSGVRTRLSAYHSRILAERILNTNATDLGRSYGLELFVHRDFTRRLAGFVSYTLGRTETTVGGATQRASWDRTHVVSVVAGYDLGRGWRAGSRAFFESGRPSPPVCWLGCNSAQGPAAEYQPPGDLPPFWRLDVRIEKRWTFAAGQWLAATLECFNVLGKAEPIGETYTPPSGLSPAAALPPNGVSVDYQSPIILPTVGAEGGF